ncbi:hypothetical protein C8A00DRAFT_40442 [Chaetomidium leptoderma]|uniref:Ubiquitin interaction domain-containing protein n=1 Tax=Chaetomidium leptoderma TaxID=669021 RepID=A0AAN6VSY0_9PEZI|nr:hypothetical protein C8A00DRAFT_40442 [Chaetomidium leptoderma]
MAFNEASVSPEQVDMVVMLTSFEDRVIITNALQNNHGNVDNVINEYFDDADKFRRKYGWDETAFSSGREGEETSANNPTVPSFAIHPPVLYGTEPASFYGAPSRPPSRANNRSPMSRLADMAVGEFNTDTPSNRQEEEDQLQRAINESLSASGVQSPHTFPPPPVPQPQQSGVTTNNGDSSVHFGPANRPDYDTDEWAMVRLGNQESDPDPTLRARKAGEPVLLRCRQDITWKKHRIGALLMIFQHIPAARNALLQRGDAPGYGYGNKSDWWQGQAIMPPGQVDPEGWMDDSTLSWSDELHRLMGFLEATERAYGTADTLARARHPETRETGDLEKDFFHSFIDLQSAEGTPENWDTFFSSAEIVALDDFKLQGGDRFGILDLQIPETFYIDRYLKANGEKLQELQMDMIALLKAYDASMQKEEELIRWVNPQTNKAYDRRVLMKAAAHRCHEKMRQIKLRAFWRQHEQAPAEGEGDYYLPDHAGEPNLLPEEAQVIAHYDAKIQEFEDKVVEMDRVMAEQILPERQAIHDVNRKMSSLLTVPSADEKWNPTHKYTLRGVVNDPNTIYQRMRGPAGASESTSAGDASAPGEERWWKTSFKPEDNTVEHIPVFYETVMREACGAGCLPIVVFATDKAMEQENLPLSDALKTFVRLDNRLFKQELLQSNRTTHKRSAVVGDGSQSKRLQRSVSIDSMATNQASVGDLDDDMRDAPFDTDSTFGVAGDAGPDKAAAQDDSIPDLVEFPQPSGTPPSSTPPAYPNDIEMETGVSPALAQVSLQDVKSSNAARSPEMQERPSALFLTRPNNGAAVDGSAANGAVAAEPEPLIDLSDGKDADVEARVNGV